MKTSLLLLSLVVLILVSCSPQEGFTEGPFLKLYNYADSELVVIFDNGKGIKDSLRCAVDEQKNVPVDMHSNEMNLLLRSRKGSSAFTFTYFTVTRKKNRNFKIHLQDVAGDIDTAANEHKLFLTDRLFFRIDGTTSQSVLTNESDWNVINQQDVKLWVVDVK